MNYINCITGFIIGIIVGFLCAKIFIYYKNIIVVKKKLKILEERYLKILVENCNLNELEAKKILKSWSNK